MWSEILNKIEKNKNFRKYLTAKDLREIKAEENNLQNRFYRNRASFNMGMAYSHPGNTPNNWANKRYANGTKNVGTNKEVTFSQAGGTYSIKIRKKLPLPSERQMNLEMKHNRLRNTWNRRIEQYFETNNAIAVIIQRARRAQILRRNIAIMRRRNLAMRLRLAGAGLPAGVRNIIGKMIRK